MNLYVQSLFLFHLPAKNTETQISKRLVCRMGYPKIRHFSCGNPPCLLVYIVSIPITLNSQYWLPVFHDFPQSSIIFHCLYYWPFSVIFHYPHNPKSNTYLIYFSEVFQAATAIFFTIDLSQNHRKVHPQEKYGQDATNVGDEGGFAPNVTESDEALQAWRKPKNILESGGFIYGRMYILSRTYRARRGDTMN